MPKRVVEVVVCHLCGEFPAGQWALVPPTGVKVKVDLCDAHARPLQQVYDAGEAPPKARGRQYLTADNIVDLDGK